jgi:hypothetical protein
VIDVSPDYKYKAFDAQVGMELIKVEATPIAVIFFASVCHRLSNYAYWFFLGTIWVSYSGKSDLKMWKRLFSSSRPKRKTSLMKPSEVVVYDELPQEITAYRAHREGETDWISYTLDRDIAERFAKERGVQEIAKYKLDKQHVLALFLRRGEQELIMLDPSKAELLGREAIGFDRITQP